MSDTRQPEGDSDASGRGPGGCVLSLLPGLFLLLSMSAIGVGSESGSREPGGLTTRGRDAPAVTVGGYVHIQWMYDFRRFASPANSFILRRGRIELAYDADRVGAEIELGCDKLRLSVKDAWVEYRVGPPLRFVAGLRKMGFSAEELEPASRRLMIERSRTNDLLNDLGYVGRDIGLAIEGDWLVRPVRFGYSLGAFNGNGGRSYRDWNDAKQFCERLTVALHDRLTLGVNATQRNDSLTGRLAVAIGGDLRYRFREMTVEGELLAGDNGPEAKMLGGFVAAAYRFGAFEPGLRLERLWPELADRGSSTTVLTAACNWRLHRRLLIKANLLTDIAAGRKLEHTAVGQVQVDF